MITSSRALAAPLLLASVLALSGPNSACAQNYPDRAVKIIVPIGPAGSYDLVGRVAGDALSKRLGQSVIVENRPGAGTIIGTQAAANAPPDGYTLLVGGLSNIVFNAGLYKKLPYDPLNDFVPVALLLNISYTLVGSKDLPYGSANEVIEAAKKRPGELKLANAGVGTGQHLVGAAFMKYTGTKFLEVPYRGSSLAFPDLLAGRVDLFFDSTPAAIPHIKSGNAKGLVVVGKARNPQILDVPTITEVGVSGLDIDSWIGIFAPTKTPPEVIARLQREIAASAAEIRPRLEAAGGEMMEVPPDKLAALIRSDYEKWINIIKEAGITLD
jgi:tripartite-type tricarboxylate transporter receptor subunit TctC